MYLFLVYANLVWSLIPHLAWALCAQGLFLRVRHRLVSRVCVCQMWGPGLSPPNPPFYFLLLRSCFIIKHLFNDSSYSRGVNTDIVF